MSEDYLASTTRLSKAIATTASQLVRQSAGGVLLLQNPHYTQAMVLALGGDTRALQRQTPSEMWRTRFSTRDKIYRATTELADELLANVPAPKLEYLLFQGFAASVGDDLPAGNLIADGLASALPRGVLVEKIRGCQNPDTLREYSTKINHTLDSLEVRKGLAAAEVGEIDDKIAALTQMRAEVVERVRQHERDETQLEQALKEIETRMALVADVAPKSYGPLLLESIYDKLQDPPSRTPSHTRRTTTTLQSYYSPGSHISLFAAHPDALTCLDFDTPFGTLCTLLWDNTVRVWNLDSERCLGLLEGHHAAVTRLQLEALAVVTGSVDALLKLWDLDRMEYMTEEEPHPLVHLFEGHVDAVSALHFHGDTLVLGAHDRTIRQWDMQSGHCVQALDVVWVQAPAGAAAIGAVQCYDAALALGTADGVVRLWDLRAGRVVRELLGHTAPVTALQFDATSLALGSQDRLVRVWDLRMGLLVDAYAYDAGIGGLQLDARRVVSWTTDGKVHLYDRALELHTEVAGAWSLELHTKESVPAPGASDEPARPLAPAVAAHYAEGYLVVGRSDGSVDTWAV